VLSQPLTTLDNKIKIGTGALKDLLGNSSLLIETEEIEDAKGPVLNQVILLPDNKTVNIKFDEPAFDVTKGLSSKEKNAILKGKISIAENGATYLPLSLSDSVELKKGVLTIKFNSPLRGADNRIKIAASTVNDVFENQNELLETGKIIADEIGPRCKDMSVNDCVSIALPQLQKNRQILITFNENIINGFVSGSRKENEALFKAAVTMKTDDGAYVPLQDKDKVRLLGNQLEIRLQTSLVQDKDYKIKIADNTLIDFFGNQSDEIITGVIEVDTTGPKLR
jgi:hypothetical protein